MSPNPQKGRNPSAPDWEDSLMQTLAWHQGESLKRLLQGFRPRCVCDARHRIQLGRVHAWKHGEDVGG